MQSIKLKVIYSNIIKRSFNNEIGFSIYCIAKPTDRWQKRGVCAQGVERGGRECVVVVRRIGSSRHLLKSSQIKTVNSAEKTCHHYYYVITNAG